MAKCNNKKCHYHGEGDCFVSPILEVIETIDLDIPGGLECKRYRPKGIQRNSLKNYIY